MTRPEISNTRNLTFSGWIRERLPDSSFGYMVSDLDFILQNYQTKKVMLLEIKQYGKKLAKWQENLFSNLDRWLRKGCDWEYLGFHTIIFEKEFFYDGKCFLDGEEITEIDLINKLSF